MHESRALKREVWLAGVALGVIALLYRYAWIPSDPEAALQHALDTFGLPVTGVGGWFTAWTLGDGQAFAVIATDPLGLNEGWRLGYPAYRYSRAGFGWLAWLASLGQAQWVPYGMAIVGVVTIVGLFWLATRLRPQLGRPAWLIALNPAVLIAFAGDTAEALGVLALAWVLATGQWWASAALGVIRPSFLVALVGRWRLLGPGVLSALVLGALWIMRFGYFPGQYGGGLGWPLVAYLEEVSVQSTLLAIAAVATLFMGIRHRHWGWVASGLMVLCFTGVVVESANNGWRTAGMLFVLWAFGPEYSAPHHRRVKAHTERSAWRPTFAARDVS
jgi:hypothetical protein